MFKGDFTMLFRTLNSGGKIEYVKIVFQNLGKYCKVYGSLHKEPRAHSVLVDKDKLPFLSVVWAKPGQMVDEKEVFEFWRKIKDGLELTLLIDVCEKTGSQLPPCFIKLPTEPQTKDIGIGFRCRYSKRELCVFRTKTISLNDDMWKQKFFEESRFEQNASDTKKKNELPSE
ncbi:F-box family protein [Artemisia annua]|uniref:F-box family protein n=1 Tax=Artemisia annua TaxID=35608 RepID=A0A2U1MW86_ARTAN|nr:F-box family protein [Artemisia annua]